MRGDFDRAITSLKTDLVIYDTLFPLKRFHHSGGTVHDAFVFKIYANRYLR